MMMGLTMIQEAAKRAQINEEHVHAHERWFGISADQGGDDWAVAAGLNPFIVVSGDSDFGTAIKVLGPDDTPAVIRRVRYDAHRIVVATLDHTTVYVLRLIWGDDAEVAEAAGDYSDMYLINDVSKANTAGGVPVPVNMPQLVVGTKLWAKVKNATDLSAIDFYIGIHEYDT